MTTTEQYLSHILFRYIYIFTIDNFKKINNYQCIA